MNADPNKVTIARQLFEKLRKGDTWTPRNTILAILAVLYIVSPIDIIPDWLPIVGWLDDIGILGVILCLILRKPSIDNKSK